MDTDQVYTRLARWLRVPDAPSFNPVLEILLTPQDAALIPELTEPASCEQLAARLNLDPQVLLPRLEALIPRGWLRKNASGHYYAPPASARFMPHQTLPGVSEEKKREVWNKFFYQDYGRVLIADREHVLETKGHNQWRFAPAGKALEMSPNILPQYILRSEDVRDMVRRATDITTHICGCRNMRQNCSRPLDNCLRVVWTGKIADNVPGGHEGEVHISAERAIEIMDESEDSGLCHTLLNASGLEDSITICSCCPCCCYLLYPVIQAGKAHKLITASRYRAVIEEEKCQGCQTCVERCAFDAIEMRKVPGSKKMKAFMINENCLGCGVCMLKCPNGAMHLEIVRPPAHIPTRPMSQASSMPTRFKEA
jgi:Na+-translocating ferredoxin:NAD+ oxidoreductase RNF subunit RnfB